jgi:hypothetical protein
VRGFIGRSEFREHSTTTAWGSLEVVARRVRIVPGAEEVRIVLGGLPSAAPGVSPTVVEALRQWRKTHDGVVVCVACGRSTLAT